MSLLIPGPKSPGRKINVYLQPLIEELKELWNFGGGVRRGIVHVLYAWVIDRPSEYEVEYLSWDIDAIFNKITCGVEVGYTMERTIRVSDLDRLERIFPPAFFSVMYVRNKTRPEGSIAEAYVMNESSTFRSRYLRGIETRFTRDERNDDTIVEDEEEKRLLHWYILNNADEISEYRKKHLRLQHRHAQNSMDLYKIHEQAFPEWFQAQVLELRESRNLSDDFFSLAMGPSSDVRCYNGCIVGGVRFHTIKLDSRRTTQNSGIMVIGESDASGTSDNNFYGVLDEVLHVQYPLERNVSRTNKAARQK
ncbi:uncharacterized protein E5676_scaffold1185G00310 [Cucumis melo var. makuwa]|uniref:DUF4218 domain-containing protein n=1 Tax=Cucumis melo var. makuwa TaxID=1194695 RepID=A0A5D3DR60_CUCMM|nr:uncharacterized protein E5676_scaffold1185G00310 [Cucumis melo var. makuwa]